MSPIDHQRIADLFLQGDNAHSAHERGKCLEDICEILFCSIPGVRLDERDINTAEGSEEIDLALWNDKTPDGLHFLPNVLICECKNWKDPVDSATIASFASKSEKRSLSHAFLFAANGLTGSEAAQRAGWKQVDDAFLKHQRYLIIVDRQEILSLRTTDDFVKLVQRKISRIILRAR